MNAQLNARQLTDPVAVQFIQLFVAIQRAFVFSEAAVIIRHCAERDQLLDRPFDFFGIIRHQPDDPVRAHPVLPFHEQPQDLSEVIIKRNGILVFRDACKRPIDACVAGFQIAERVVNDGGPKVIVADQRIGSGLLNPIPHARQDIQSLLQHPRLFMVVGQIDLIHQQAVIILRIVLFALLDASRQIADRRFIVLQRTVAGG